MKKRGGYEFESGEGNMEYYFWSIGPKGRVLKIVKFTLLDSNLCNLAFGDVIGDDFDDEVITDNGDFRKVIQTIVNIAFEFAKIHPNRRILIYPVDHKRKLLYNRIFQQYNVEFQQDYSIEGRTLVPSIAEPFDPRKNYDVFILTPLPLSLKP